MTTGSCSPIFTQGLDCRVGREAQTRLTCSEAIRAGSLRLRHSCDAAALRWCTQRSIIKGLFIASALSDISTDLNMISRRHQNKISYVETKVGPSALSDISTDLNMISRRHQNKMSYVETKVGPLRRLGGWSRNPPFICRPINLPAESRSRHAAALQPAQNLSLCDSR